MTAGRDTAAVKFGPGRLYVAPLGTTEPASLSVAPDAAFVDLGYTKDGSRFVVSRDTVLFKVAEEVDEIDAQVTGRSSRLIFNLAQDTAANWKTAHNGGTIGSQAGAVTFVPPEPGTEVKVMLLWEDGATSAANTRRLLIRKAFQVGDSEIEHIKPDGEDDYTGIPVEFAVLKPTGAEPYKAWFSTALSGS